MLLSKFEISGHSMMPTYKPGDKVLISSVPYLFKKPQVGDIIVFKKEKITLIKRISKITANGIIVEGDNLEDTLSSVSMGIISRKDVLGKVILRL